MPKIISVILISLLFCSACENQAEQTADLNNLEQQKVTKKIPPNIQTFINNVEPFFEEMGDPNSGEWLSRFQEDGQTFKEFYTGEPTLPTKKRQIIYIQPIGDFNAKQLKIIKSAVKFIEVFYNLPTKLLKVQTFKQPLSLANQRTHPQWNIKQVRTGFILYELLLPNLPEDAAALISFTNIDLYPEKDFNFVFGQASLKNRVGVWSLYRLQKNADANLFLKRTIKLAIHETGHMFSFYHCTKFSCAMNGSNHMVESDQHPLDFCPEDAAKIVWMTDALAKERYQQLARICKRIGLNDEAKLFQEKAKAVS